MFIHEEFLRSNILTLIWQHWFLCSTPWCHVFDILGEYAGLNLISGMTVISNRILELKLIFLDVLLLYLWCFFYPFNKLGLTRTYISGRPAYKTPNFKERYSKYWIYCICMIKSLVTTLKNRFSKAVYQR